MTGSNISLERAQCESLRSDGSSMVRVLSGIWYGVLLLKEEKMY